MEDKIFDLMYDLLHILRDNKAIDRKQFDDLFKLLKEAELNY